MIKAGDIRKALAGLSDEAAVLISDHPSGEWANNDRTVRELRVVSNCWDGRYGNTLVFHLGGFADPWNGTRHREQTEKRDQERRKHDIAVAEKMATGMSSYEAERLIKLRGY